MAVAMSALALGDKVTLEFKTATQEYSLYDLTVRAVESDSIVVMDSMGPITLVRTQDGWRGEGAKVTVTEHTPR